MSPVPTINRNQNAGLQGAADIETNNRRLVSVYSNGFMDRPLSLSPATARVDRPQSISKQRKLKPACNNNEYQ